MMKGRGMSIRSKYFALADVPSLHAMSSLKSWSLHHGLWYSARFHFKQLVCPNLKDEVGGPSSQIPVSNCRLPEHQHQLYLVAPTFLVKLTVCADILYQNIAHNVQFSLNQNSSKVMQFVNAFYVVNDQVHTPQSDRTKYKETKNNFIRTVRNWKLWDH